MGWEANGQKGAEQERRGSESTRGADRGGGGGGGSVQLSSDQRTKIRQTVISNSSARVDHVDFSLSVGTTVPRTVHFVRLPETVVEIVPQYRGYDYIIVVGL